MPPRLRTGFMGGGVDRLYVRDVGHGVPIVVLRGGPDFDHRFLLPELDRLAESFRLIYYDQRGRGRSFCGQRPGEVTITSELDDLDRIRTQLDLDAFVVPERTAQAITEFLEAP